MGSASATGAGAGAGTAAGEAATRVLAAATSRPRGNALLAMVVLYGRARGFECGSGHATRLCGLAEGRGIQTGNDRRRGKQCGSRIRRGKGYVQEQRMRERREELVYGSLKVVWDKQQGSWHLWL